MGIIIFLQMYTIVIRGGCARTRHMTSACMRYCNVFFQTSQSESDERSGEKRKNPRGTHAYQTPVRPIKMIPLRAIAQRSSVHRPRNIFSSRREESGGQE